MENISEEKRVLRKGGHKRQGKGTNVARGGVGGKGNVSGKRGVGVRHFCLKYQKEPNTMYMLIKSLILNKDLLYRFLRTL